MIRKHYAAIILAFTSAILAQPAEARPTLVSTSRVVSPHAVQVYPGHDFFGCAVRLVNCGSDLGVVVRDIPWAYYQFSLALPNGGFDEAGVNAFCQREYERGLVILLSGIDFPRCETPTAIPSLDDNALSAWQ